MNELLVFYLCFCGAPVLLALFVVIIGYRKALKSANEIPKAVMDQLGFKKLHLLLYPIVLLMAFLPNLVDGIASIYFYPPPFWLLILDISISHSIGSINALLYINLRKLYQIGSPDRISEGTDFVGTCEEIESMSSSMMRHRKTSLNGSLFVY